MCRPSVYGACDMDDVAVLLCSADAIGHLYAGPVAYTLFVMSVSIANIQFLLMSPCAYLVVFALQSKHRTGNMALSQSLAFRQGRHFIGCDMFTCAVDVRL